MQLDPIAPRAGALAETFPEKDSPELIAVLLRLNALEVRLEILEDRERAERRRNADSYDEM